MDDSLARALDRLNGIGRRSELIAAGASPASFDPAWREGTLLRVRHGTYAKPECERQIVRAARVGGALAGLSAAKRYGLWQPPDPTSAALTVSVQPNAPRLRDPDDASRRLDRGRKDVRILHDGHLLHSRHERLCVGLPRCLAQVMPSMVPEYALAVLDSAIRLEGGHIDLASLAGRVPSRCQATVAAADARAESGTESIMRWGLLRARIPFVIQQKLAPGIRVDFVLAGFLVIECTSYEYHASPQQYEDDRRRIAAAVRLGYVVLEFTYHQVLFDWDRVLATIMAALAAGRSGR